MCGDKLKEWRALGDNLAIVDLKSAYLQIHVAEDLWKYQVVRFHGKYYALTRLGFGLNVAPKIMTTIVRKVLSINDKIESATDSYIDDIVINLERISSEDVVKQLNFYGLETKEPERLGSCRVLGVKTYRKGNSIHWKRDNDPPATSDHMSKRQIFAFTGAVLGHYPVAGKLTLMSSMLKR